MSRVWVYQTLMNYAPLTALAGDRGFQGESMDGSPVTKPFWVYRFGNTSPDNELHAARRQYFTVYCHDEAMPGDYVQIDAMIDAVVDAFIAAPPSPADRILEARWLESSSDQDDREMGTILRYVRFQLILSEWT